MPRFVVLAHDSPRGLHWDLMLEEGATLRTWALERPPDARGPIGAEALPDHRLSYLDYEGPVSGDRGSVVRWDQGTYRLEREQADQLALRMVGQRLVGRAVLRREAQSPDRWRFDYSAD